MSAPNFPLAAAIAAFPAPLEPLPLAPPARLAQAYPVDALGGSVADAAHAIAEMVQCPLALAGQSVLAVAALAAQGHADAQHPLGHAVPSSLLLVTLAESGERKSTADKYATQAVHEAVDAQQRDYRANYARWRSECEAREACRAKVKRGGRAQREWSAIAAELSEIGVDPEAPLNPLRIVSDPNYEGLIKFAAHAHGSLGWFNNEAGQSLGGTALHDENKLKFGAGLSKFWDGQAIDRIRAGDGAHVLNGRRLTAHLMIQPDIARPFLSDPVMRAQGWLSRALICEPPSNIGARPFREPSAADRARLNPFERRVRELIETPCSHGDKANELAPPPLPWSADASRAWPEFHNAVEASLASEGVLAEHRGFGAKLAENAFRIATVLACIEGASEVSGAVMARAITLADHYAQEAVRHREAAAIGGDVALAERTRLWLIDAVRWERGDVKLRDVMQFGPAKARSKAKAEKVIGILQEHGWLTVSGDGYVIRGRSP